MNPNPIVAAKIMTTLVNAVNLWLKATGSPTRVSPDGITITRRNGVLFIAFREANHD